MIKRLRKKFMIHFIMIFILSIIGFSVLLSDIKSINDAFNIEFLVLFIIPLSFALLLIYIGRQFYLSNINKYKKAQYGKVDNKYSLKTASSNSRKRNYYIDVYFPKTDEVLKGIYCDGQLPTT